VSALKKNTSTSKSTSKKSSAASGSKDNGASPKDAKGKTSVKATAKFAGGLAVAAKGTPPETPKPPKQAPKPKVKKTGVTDAAIMGANPASDLGADQGTPSASFTGGGPGALKGSKSETSKAAKKVTKQKPSKILKAYKGLGKQVTAAKKKDEGKAHKAIPAFHAVLPGDAAMEAKGKKQNTKADTKVDDKVGGSEAKAPKLKKQKKGKATRQKVDGKSSAEMKRLAAMENALDAIKSMFANMAAGIGTDSNVNTDPGPAPEIVFSGKSNPQRADKAHTEADTKINDGHEKFAEAIDKGKQPGDVKRLEVDDITSALQNPDLKIGEEQLQEGEKYYQKLIKQHTAQEIDGADKILDGEVQAKMGKANADMDKVLLKQETDRQKSVEKAKSDIDSKNLDAKAEQEQIVGKSKKDIAKAQKETRKKQDGEVKKAKRKGDKERRKVEKNIEVKEKKDESKIVKEYDKAEKKADNEEKKAETKARKKKKEAEKKKKESSWWDRVKSAVGDFVDSVCSAIGDIFDALGSLVSGLLNAVKDLACAVIDAAISWAKKALDGLGSLLKGLVSGLIGDLFPELAKKLNEAIDSGIDLAKKGCDVVGEKLKEGVTAAVDTVNAVVQKGLQVAKVGLQTAVRVTGCIATGDFEGAFLATFYGALEIAGVSKGDADKMLGDASETLKLIVDKPGDFAGNLIDAGKDGFVSFGANFLGHFTSAVTGWLLGPVAAAGLQAPEEWNAQGIFGMVMGVLGVDGDSLKGMAEERIGEKNMAALDKAYEYVTGFIEGGFAGLWDQLKGDLGNIWDLVLGMITDYITKKVVQFGMEQLASLLAGPLGALWQALKTAWGIYCTIRDKINEIKEVLGAVFNSISDIARGNTTKASAWVESALQKVLGIAIDLGANLAGIGDIPDKIRGFVEGLQERVKTAIGKAMDWVLEKVKGLFAGGKDEKEEAKPAEDESKQDNGRKATQLPGATIATSMGAINVTFGEPSANGAPPILQSTGVVAGALRAKGLPGLEKDIKKADKSPGQTKALESMKHAKGVAMGLENKGLRYLAGEDNLGDARKSMDLLSANLLDAASFAGSLKKRDDGVDVLPEPIKFKATDGESHTMFVRRKGGKAELTVRSVEKPIKDRIDDWKTDLQKLGKDDKKKAGGFIGKAIAMEKVAGKQADDLAKLTTGHKDIPKLESALAQKLLEVSGQLGNLFGLFGKPPHQWVPSIHDPFKHPNYIEFRDRATKKLNPPMSLGEVDNLWKKVLAAAGIACESQANEKAGKEPENDASVLLHEKARGAYKTIASVMLKDRFSLAKAGGKGYALWSGGSITMQFAFKQGYTALEKTDAGTLFDNLAILDDNWDAEKLLWEELSRQYSQMPEIGRIHAFQRWQGNVFSKIEKPEIVDRARKTKSTAKLWWHYHSIVGAESFSKPDLDTKYGLEGPKKVDDLSDVGESYDEGGWQGKLDAHDKKLEDKLSGKMPSGAAPDTTKLVALMKRLEGGGPETSGWMASASEAAALYSKLHPTLPRSEQHSMPNVMGAIAEGLGTVSFDVDSAAKLTALCTQGATWVRDAEAMVSLLRASTPKKLMRAVAALEVALKVGPLAAAMAAMQGSVAETEFAAGLTRLTDAYGETGYPYQKQLRNTLGRVMSALVVRLRDDMKTRTALFAKNTEALWDKPEVFEAARDRQAALLASLQSSTLGKTLTNQMPSRDLKDAAEVLGMKDELNGLLSKLPADVRHGNKALSPKNGVTEDAKGKAQAHLGHFKKALAATSALASGEIEVALKEQAEGGMLATKKLSAKECAHLFREAFLSALKGVGSLSAAGLGQLVDRLAEFGAKKMFAKVKEGSTAVAKSKKVEKSSFFGNLARLGGIATMMASSTLTGKVVGGTLACLGRFFISMKSGRNWKQSFADGVVEALVFTGMTAIAPVLGSFAMAWGSFGLAGAAAGSTDVLYKDAKMAQLQLKSLEDRLGKKGYTLPQTLTTPMLYLGDAKNG